MNSSAPKPRPGPCPCGTGTNYTLCCGRWHSGDLAGQAPDAESLMRSRYSAYALGLSDYLLQTWHPRTRPAPALTLDPALHWLGLQVQHHQVQDEHHATVAFVARYKTGGRATRLQETSRFVHEDGRWYYLDGDVL